MGTPAKRKLWRGERIPSRSAAAPVRFATSHRPRPSMRRLSRAAPALAIKRLTQPSVALRRVLSRDANPRPSQGIAPRRRLLVRSYRHLDLDERRTLFRLIEARTPVAELAARLGRHPSTVYRELGRNRFRGGDRGFCGYFPLNAQ